MNVTANPQSLTAPAALRLALQLDAAVSGLNGVIYLVAAGALDSVLGVPEDFLRAAGAFMVVYAAAITFLSTRRRMPRPAVWVVIEGNAAWALASIALVAFDWMSPTTGGAIWALLQGLIVAGFAGLQYAALRRY